MTQKRARQASLLEHAGGTGVPLNVCPCCLGLTTRDPAEILAEVEAEEQAKRKEAFDKEMERFWAQQRKQIELERTHYRTLRISEKTGKFFTGKNRWEWEPKYMRNDFWRIPRDIYWRYVAEVRDVAPHFVFKGRKHIYILYYCERTMRTINFTHTIDLTFWDFILASLVGKVLVGSARMTCQPGGTSD